MQAVASFVNLNDVKNKLGFVIILTDDTKNINWLQYRSYNWKTVVKSVLGGETHAFVDAFEAAYEITYDMSNTLQIRIPLNIVAKYEPLFNVIVQSSNKT